MAKIFHTVFSYPLLLMKGLNFVYYLSVQSLSQFAHTFHVPPVIHGFDSILPTATDAFNSLKTVSTFCETKENNEKFIGIEDYFQELISTSFKHQKNYELFLKILELFVNNIKHSYFQNKSFYAIQVCYFYCILYVIVLKNNLVSNITLVII